MMATLEEVRGKPLSISPKTWRNKYLPMLATAFGLFLAGAIWWAYIYEPTPEIIRPPIDEVDVFTVLQVELNDPTRVFSQPDSLFEAKLLGMRNACPEKLDSSIRLDFDTTGVNSFYYKPLRVGKDTLCLELLFEQGITDTTRIIFNVFERAEAPSVEEEPIDTIPYLEQKRLVLRDDKLMAMPAPTPLQKWLFDYQWWIKTISVLLFAWGLFMLVKWRQRQRQQYILDYQPNTKPPYVWNIAMGDEPDMKLNEGFFKLLNLLRQRTAAEAWRFSVPKTVKATIKKGGRPSFVYNQQTRPPEYLVLIDQQNSRNHRTRLFDFFFKKIKASDVYIERYFFNGDLRLCWNEQHPEGIFLKDLLHRYSASRLLISSTGYRLLSPRNGRLAGWTKLLTGWRERALISPVPPSEWGRKERTLDSLFHVVPSGTVGLFQAIDRFESEEPSALNEEPDQHTQQSLYLGGNLIDRLYFYFAEKDEFGWVKSDLFLRWIAACAVYPDIHWELTLQLARLLSTEVKNLCDIQQMSRLCQLPWFVEGKMPEEVRASLVHWLESNHPDTLLQVRTFIYETLKKNPPPEDSSAFDNYRMNLCLNEWMLTKDKKRKKQLETEIARRLEQGHEADYISIKKLEGEKGFLDQLIPESWKKALRPSDAKKGKWSDLLWALPIWFFFSLGLMVIPLKLPECEGRIVEVEDKKWCIDTPEKELWVKEYYAYDFLRKRKYAAVDSILKTLHPLVDDHLLDTVPLYKNLAGICYNRGVTFFNQKIDSEKTATFAEGINGPQLTDSLYIENLEAFIGKIFSEGMTETDSSTFVGLVQENEAAFYQYFSEVLADSACAMFQRAKGFEIKLGNKIWDNEIIEAAGEYCPKEAAKEVELIFIITDAENNTPLQGVEIKATDINLSTDRNGQAKIKLEEGAINLFSFSKNKYENINREIIATSENNIYEIQLIKITEVPKFISNIATIYFDFDRYQIRQDAKLALDSVLLQMKQNPSWLLEVTPYFSGDRTSVYNQQISQKRADSVVKYLVDKGVRSERIVVLPSNEVRVNQLNVTEQEKRRVALRLIKTNVAQNISFQIVDAKSKKPIAGASVELYESLQQGKPPEKYIVDQDGKVNLEGDATQLNIAVISKGNYIQFKIDDLKKYLSENNNQIFILERGRDLDGDGVPNENDNCPTETGPRENKGCPNNNGRTFSATLVNFNSNPLANIKIEIKGENLTTTTDVNGKFNIFIPDEKTTIIIEKIGEIIIDETPSETITIKTVYEQVGPGSSMKISNLTLLNSTGNEYSVTPFGDGFIYVSINGYTEPITVSSRFQKGFTKELAFDSELIAFETNDEGLPVQETKINQGANDRIESISVSGNGETVYISKRIKIDGGYRYSSYVGTIRNNTINNLTPLPFNSDEFDTFSPAISKNGQLLIFCSNRPGSILGSDGNPSIDLWGCRLENGVWSIPYSLGPGVNTDQDELLPTIMDNGALFFSSAGHSGEGGLDIFVALPGGGDEYELVGNIGTPYNSPSNEYGFIASKDEKKFYFVSDKPTWNAQGSGDIYMCKTDYNPEGVILLGARLEEVRLEGAPLDAVQLMENRNVSFMKYGPVLEMIFGN